MRMFGRLLVPAIVNSDQAQAWNGYEGRHWAEHQDRWDAVNHSANDSLFGAAAIDSADSVLDIGCGNGATSRIAARQALCGRVFGIDLSEPMLERARAIAASEGLVNVQFEQGDAQVYPFPSGNFDVAISRFAVMFFADPVAAFANISRALRPGGRLAFVSLGDFRTNDLRIAFAALARHVPNPAPAAAAEQGPLSLADPVRIRTVLEAAGFDDVSTTPLELNMLFGRDAADAADFLVNSGPVHFALEQAHQLSNPVILESITDALRPFEQSDGVRLRGDHWLVRATHPVAAPHPTSAEHLAQRN
jgi:SAM-dependent methyltransferase